MVLDKQNSNDLNVMSDVAVHRSLMPIFHHFMENKANSLGAGAPFLVAAIRLILTFIYFSFENS